MVVAAIAKVDPDGNLIFQKRLQLIVGGNYATVPYSVKSTTDSGYIMTGFTDYDRFIYGDNTLGIKTDAQGNAPLIVGISNPNSIVNNKFILNQNYPNPFNPTTTIRFEIPVKGNITLKVYDAIGKEVEILVNENKPAGSYSVSFDGSNLTSGIYFYQIISNGDAGNFISTNRMILLK